MSAEGSLDLICASCVFVFVIYLFECSCGWLERRGIYSWVGTCVCARYVSCATLWNMMRCGIHLAWSEGKFIRCKFLFRLSVLSLFLHVCLLPSILLLICCCPTYIFMRNEFLCIAVLLQHGSIAWHVVINSGFFFVRVCKPPVRVHVCVVGSGVVCGVGLGFDWVEKKASWFCWTSTASPGSVTAPPTKRPRGW